jgi:hypothetical protein
MGHTYVGMKSVPRKASSALVVLGMDVLLTAEVVWQI